MKLFYESKNLEYKHVKIIHYIWVILILGFLFSGFGFTTGLKINNIIEKIPVIIRTEEQRFSDENLKQEIKRLNLKFGDAVYKQAIVEGSSLNGKRWSNPYFVNGNNFMGMKHSFLRSSTAIGWGDHDYCIYKSWRDCLLDYCIWQAQNCSKIHTEDEYYQLLQDMGYSIKKDTYTALLKQVK